MRRYNILQPLWLAFYSKALYRDVRHAWQKLVFAYLLLLIALCYLPLAYHLHIRINQFTQNLQPWTRQLPTIIIQDHQVSIDAPVPYTIKNPDNGHDFAIIDTSGNINTLENTDAPILLTRTQLLVRANAHSVKTYNFTQLNNHRYTADDVKAFAEKIGAVFIFVFYPFIILFYFLAGLLEALVYTVLAKLFINTDLPFQQLFRLAIVAITPQVIIFSLLGLLTVTLPYKWIIYFALGMGYLFFAIEANRGGKI
jgi:hypothetical protein